MKFIAALDDSAFEKKDNIWIRTHALVSEEFLPQTLTLEGTLKKLNKKGNQVLEFLINATQDFENFDIYCCQHYFHTYELFNDFENLIPYNNKLPKLVRLLYNKADHVARRTAKSRI